MSEENKKTTTENKILSFHISDEDILNPEMDHFMLDSLKKEADELEARLNADPSLAGVEAPEGLFQSIVDELKAQGVWREEGEDGEPAESGGSRGPEKSGGNRDSGGSVESAESVGSGEKSAEAVCDGESAGRKSRGEGTGTAGAADCAGADEAVNAEEMKMNREGAGRSGTSDAVYDMLSEEDRRALELGRKVGEKQQKRAERRRKRHRALKIAGVIAAMVVLVFGASMTSEANRRLVMKMWDGMLVDFGFRVNTEYLGDKETIRSKSKEELAAIEDIHEKLGVQMIEFGYLPEEMEYIGYDIKKNMFEAVLVYSYQEMYFYVTILNIDKEGATYYSLNEDAVLRESVTSTSDSQITAEIWETNIDLGKEAYIAEIEYEGWRYVLNGMIPLEEMKKILDNALFL